MTKQEMLEQMIAQIMEDFDFERVHKVMEFVDWKWMGTDGKEEVPSMYRLMKRAEELLRTCALHYGKESNHITSTGGFAALLDGETLSLQFHLEEATSYPSEFVEDNERISVARKGMLDRPITDYPLSVRALTCLKLAGIKTLRELVRHKESDLLKFRNFGKRSITELSDFLKDHDLEWGMEV